MPSNPTTLRRAQHRQQDHPVSYTSSSADLGSIALSSSTAARSTGGSTSATSVSSTVATTPTGPVLVTMLQIYSVTASSGTSRGTASMSLTLNNPGPPTAISSILLTGLGLPPYGAVYQCSSGTSCSPLFTAASPPLTVGENSATTFTGPASAFFLGSAIAAN